ncbi:MAG: SDR family NAD(P)-dependent oxidoreductase [Bacteroidaceae bacterium]|nr:SDR family NAD(P)-dependent oxidoreductase [Bacteroidaceae bacterium]
MQFKDKVIIVTGGAQGIGRCIVEEFRKEGALVCVIDKQEGNHYVSDLSHKDVIEEFCQWVIAEHMQLKTQFS